MKMKFVAVMTAGLMIFGITGCGSNQIPEMTDEEMRQLGEYTAMTLMKYEANNRSRLVDYSRWLVDEEPEAAPEQESPEPGGMDPVDDTPVVSAPSGGGGTEAYSMEDVLGLPEGVSIVYVEEAVYDSYPENNSFSVTASTGKKLLVLQFVIINASDQEQSIDFLTPAPEFRITVNGDYTRRAMLTMLEEDLTVYQGTISSMGSSPAILMIEVDDERAAGLSSVSLSVKNDSKSCTILLF